MKIIHAYALGKIDDFLLQKAMKTYGHRTLKYVPVEYVFFTAHHDNVQCVLLITMMC
jgi:hypothetical protein